MNSQNEQIKQHLLAGNSITPLQSLYLFGSFRLGARIKDLRDSGMDIETEMVQHGKKRFAKYFMKDLQKKE